MAIAQERYVKITSMNVNDTAVADRELGGLVFTTTSRIKVYNAKTDKWEEDDFAKDMIIECFDSTQVGNIFDTTSKEYDYALEYFSYMSPSGRAPTKLSFALIENGEDPVKALERVNKDSNNFGSFCYLQGGEYTLKQMKDVVEKNDEFNYKYLFSIAFPYAGGDDESSESNDATSIDPSTKVKDSTALDFQRLLSGDADASTFTGYVVTLGRIKDSEDNAVDFNNAAVIPMAIFASTNYSQANSSTFFMFKQLDAQDATVTSDEIADIYDRKFVNYMGLVQVNGRRRKFYQRGVNGNGEATSVYCNEVWLKSRIATDLIDLMVSVEKIPANADGELLIRSVISTDAELAISNGVIEKNKTLDAAQRRKVYNLTHDNEAYREIEQGGYRLEVEIVKGTKFNTEEYKAVYRLIYSKGDAICAVEGTHFLV